MAEDYVIGQLAAIFFEKPEDYFKIMLIKVRQTSFKWADAEIVVTGDFDDLDENQIYKFTGQVVNHPKYGQQFKASHYQKDSPTDRKSLVAYLSSSDFPGIGVKMATKIIDRLGDSAIQKILTDPEAVHQIGLRPQLEKTLINQIKATYQSQTVVLQLNTWGFGNKMALKIYHHYGEETLELLANNPYRLIKDIPGIGFRRADHLAQELALSTDYPQRIAAGLWTALTAVIHAQGDTYVPQEVVITTALKLLNTGKKPALNREQLASGWQYLEDADAIVLQEKNCFPKYLYDSEWMIARQLKLLQQHFQKPKLTKQKFQQIVTQLEIKLDIHYDHNQSAAIKAGLENSLLLLTGGPGTGKTTIVNGLVQAFAQLHEYSLDPADYQDKPFPILLAAPTGRAAKHLFESTGLMACTIHRLLGLTGQEDVLPTEVGELAGSLLVIDETSMVDTNLFQLLLMAIPLGMQIVLVGDQDQLPSVGPGQVFSDLIASQAFTTVKLEKIYRQDAESTIIDLAHQINQNQVTPEMFKNYPDRSFIECNAQQVGPVLKQIMVKSQAKGFTLDQVQVLAPMYHGPAGIDHLNLELQQALNPVTDQAKELRFGDVVYHIGDKVIHLVNNAEANVFNGEIGTVVGITLATGKNQGDQIHLDFEGHQLDYSRADLKNIALAYCASIHKAQGSEFDLVILVLVRQQSRMLRRNLLYTAVTRARSKLIMLGNQSAYQQAIHDQLDTRKTYLQQRLQDVFELPTSPMAPSQEQVATEDYQLTLVKINQNQIDPLIGMEDVCPQDFLES
ncbi:ATP-dependent RecD-like DNA helicase [Lactobacillus sp. DCY120]|uniref:ATP-dependent RecD2 DNA helicase n=1 Tax=Bombilactobacillus apium TaxID=2675299 RepID=A0A850QYB1_9LACO|nr:ATP-dependent RecD-like DNA helicase [Bombilactobacillus apium]NVY95699.1 ATP-dependent RecD-like DNA helicase [Bombilactobacillus apium]